MTTDRIVAEIREAVAERPEIAAAYLFGSAAREERTALSDVDVAVLFETGVPEDRRERLAVRLTGDLGRRLGEGPHRVEVHDVEVLPLAIRGRVLTGGIRAGGEESALRVRFEDVTLRRYLDFLPISRLQTEEGLRGLRERLSGG